MYPTNVTRLEAELCRRGHADYGCPLPLHADANDEGHAYYADVSQVKAGGVWVDLEDRYSQRGRVRMSLSVPAERLGAVCEAIAATHRSRRERVTVDAIVTVKTAVAVCEALEAAEAADGKGAEGE